jgi:uncharacterized protein (DUF1684 family)
MLKKLLIAAAILSIIIYFISESTNSTGAYTARIHQLRRQKNRAFRTNADAPLSKAQIQVFDSLKYYVPNPDFRIEATFERSSRPDTVRLQMSDNKEEHYLRWGKADFTIGTGSQHLTLFQRIGGADSTLFVPFTDLTNGHDSYGGGRYLDVPRPAPAAKTVELDFNQTYNPYCAYNDDYSCPLPPAENRLTVAIPAGEQSFHE